MLNSKTSSLSLSLFNFSVKCQAFHLEIKMAFLKMLLIDNQNVFADDARSLNGHHVSDEPAIYMGKRKGQVMYVIH